MADDTIATSATERGPAGGPRDLLAGLSSYLQARGHRERTRQAYLASAEHFLRWASEGSDPEAGPASVDLTPAAAYHFLVTHLPTCRCPSAGLRDVKTVRAALRHLLAMAGTGPLRTAGQAMSGEIEAAVDEFDRHLREVCGLAEATRWYHRRHARAFLGWLAADRPVAFSEITPGVLMRFVTERAADYRPGSVGVLAYSLRSYLRFLAFRGLAPASLVSAIPRPPNWSLAGLPSSLDGAELTRFLAAFDRSSPMGQRDYAMARCLVDLGLRCGEVAGMSLEAIDWREGVLRLPKTKSNHEDRLPIPEPTGQALVDYVCRGRPDTDSRAVFVHHRPPTGHPVGATTVRGVIRRAFRRVGLPWTGTHILRRTMATRLLRGGATLKEIADVLRHRSLDTTQLYTKVDLAQLSRVALPWPGRPS